MLVSLIIAEVIKTTRKEYHFSIKSVNVTNMTKFSTGRTEKR